MPCNALCRELDAEGGVRSWTDFLKVYLHPQSLCLLPGLWQGACNFSGFGHGSGAVSGGELGEEALDRVRMFAEECDALQVTPPANADMRGCVMTYNTLISVSHWSGRTI